MYGYATVTGRAGKLLDHFGIGRFIQCLPRANPLHAREVVPTSNPRYRWNLGNRSVLDFCTCIGEVGLGVPEYRRLDAIKPTSSYCRPWPEPPRDLNDGIVWQYLRSRTHILALYCCGRMVMVSYVFTSRAFLVVLESHS